MNNTKDKLLAIIEIISLIALGIIAIFKSEILIFIAWIVVIFGTLFVLYILGYTLYLMNEDNKKKGKK